MAKLSKPPIPLKMYKHFAVVTVSMTAAIAMFADSDNREAVAEHIEEQQDQAELRRASAERFGAPQLVRNDDRSSSGGSFGSEYVAAPAPVGGGGRGGAGNGSAGSGRPAVGGYDQAFIDGLSPAEYEAFLASLPEDMRRSATREGRAEQRAALEQASARRSGNNGPSADAPG